MKLIIFLSVFSLLNSVVASDFSDKLLTAAKDKKNQEQAKEIAKKGVEYIKGEKKAEVKPEPTPEVTGTPAPPPSDKPIVKKAKKKKKKS
jgi:outer membrane biosynthesis protein TonB